MDVRVNALTGSRIRWEEWFVGILSFVNPFAFFAFSKKYYAAWNALMAAYTFEHLSPEQKQQVMDKAVEIESDVHRRPVIFIEIVSNFNEAQLNHLFSLAMMNVSIRPAIGNEQWFEVKNPHIDLLNGAGVLAFTKRKLEKQFGVEFPDLSG